MATTANVPGDFLRLRERWSPGFGFETLTFLAIRDDDEWLLEYAHVVYSAPYSDGIPPDLSLKTDSIWAVRHSTNVGSSEWTPCINLETGPLAVRYEDRELRLRSINVRAPIYSYFPVNHPATAGSLRVPALEVRSYFDGPKRPVDAGLIEMELASSDTPYDGIADLTGAFALPSGWFEFVGHKSSIEISMQPPVRPSNECRFEDGEAVLVMESAREVNPEDVSIGLRGVSQQGIVQRRTVPGTEFDWSETVVGKKGEHRFDPKGAIAFNLYSRFHNEFAGKHYFQDQAATFNRLLSMHRLVDTDSTVERDLLHGDGGEFELAVNLLLNLMGIKTILYGPVPEFGDWADLFAITAENTLLPIECTAGPIDHKGKLNKFNRRIKKIRELNSSQGLGFTRIMPVVVTNLGREETEGSWATLRDLGMAVVAREDLEMMLERLEIPVPHEEFEKVISQLVPSDSANGTQEPSA